MNKKVPVVSVAEPAEAANLAGLGLEATVALADLAGAVKEGLLGFCAERGSGGYAPDARRGDDRAGWAEARQAAGPHGELARHDLRAGGAGRPGAQR